MAGIFERLNNVWRGFLSLWISDIEARNPEAVYEAAIAERVRKHAELKKAVSGIVYLRNKTDAELEEKNRELREVLAQLPVALEEGEDDVALILIQKKDQLEAAIERLNEELTKISVRAEESKSSLLQFQGEIEKLKREKQEMLAQKATAEAQIQINETLDGLSTDADIQALEGVREHIGKIRSEADLSSEMRNNSLDEKLRKIRSKAADSGAKAQLAEMKKQMASKKAAAEGAAVKKSI